MKLLISVKILPATIFLRWGYEYFPTHSGWGCPPKTASCLHLRHFLNPGRVRWGMCTREGGANAGKPKLASVVNRCRRHASGTWLGTPPASPHWSRSLSSTLQPHCSAADSQLAVDAAQLPRQIDKLYFV
jgi:hypothetical protein